MANELTANAKPDNSLTDEQWARLQQYRIAQSRAREQAPQQGFQPSAGMQRPQRPSGRNFFQAVNQRRDAAYADQMGRYQENRQKQEQIRGMLSNLVAQDPSIDIEKIAPPETDMSTWQFVSELQKSLRKRQKEKERQGQVQPEVNRLPGLIAGGQPGPAREILSQLNPQELARASQQLGLQLPGARIDRQQAQQDALAETQKFRSQERFKQEIKSDNDMIQDLSMGIATNQLAIPDATAHFYGMGRDPETIYELTERLRAAVVGQRVKLKMAQGITEGNADLDAQHEWNQQQLASPDVTLPNGNEVLLTRNMTRNQMNGTVALLPHMGKLYALPTSGPVDQKRLVQEFYAVDGLQDQIRDTEESMFRIRQKVNAGDLTREALLLGKGWQSILRRVGGQDKDVADYQTRSFLTIAFVLKAIQGSRPSDFDFKNFLAVMPLLQEIMSETGPSRLRALHKLVENNQLARFSHTVKGQMQDMKRSMAASSTHQREDAEVDKAIAKYRAVVDKYDRGDATPADRDAALAVLMDAGEKWRKTGAGANWVTPGSGELSGLPIDPQQQNKVDKYLKGL